MSDPLAPYAEQHKNPQGPGDQRPTALDIVRDNDLVDKRAGTVALVTGATSGIGVETVRALHATGADVYFTARNMDKAASTLDDIRARSAGKGRLEAIQMDMESLDSVRKAADEFLRRSSKLNVLVNNAGVMAPPYTKTRDGFELQFGVNHLAHFLLTVRLLPALVAGSTPELNSRVVNLTSSGHRYSRVRLDDYNFAEPDSYQPFLGYGQSKTANVWMANHIDRLFGPRGVHALSVHPGGIETGLQVYVPEEQLKVWKDNPAIKPIWKTTEQGAATTLWAAVGKVWEGSGGKYLADCRFQPTSRLEDMTDALSNEAAPWAYSPEDEEKLWKLSVELVGEAAAL